MADVVCRECQVNGVSRGLGGGGGGPGVGGGGISLLMKLICQFEILNVFMF